MPKNCKIINKKTNKNKNHYATIGVNGKTILAHRYLYEKRYGKIPEGMVVDHLCRNPMCVNLNHLEMVTIAENTRRGKVAKLNYSIVEKIRTMYKNIRITQTELGIIFGVGQHEISRVVNYRRWS